MEIKLYSAEWCTFCKKVKTFLDNNNVEHEIIDIDKDVSAKPWIKSQGLRTIPIAVIDGEILPDSELIIEKVKENLQ